MPVAERLSSPEGLARRWMVPRGKSSETAGQRDRGGWKRIDDIAPRDHQSLVEDGRGGVLMYAGIPAARSGPWPTDTRELQGGIWKRVSTEGPPGRGRAALAYDSKRRRWCRPAASARRPDPISRRRFSTTPGSGKVNAGANKRQKAVRADDTLMDGVR